MVQSRVLAIRKISLVVDGRDVHIGSDWCHMGDRLLVLPIGNGNADGQLNQFSTFLSISTVPNRPHWPFAIGEEV